MATSYNLTTLCTRGLVLLVVALTVIGCGVPSQQVKPRSGGESPRIERAAQADPTAQPARHQFLEM